MDGYALGKDIQTILGQLQELSRKLDRKESLCSERIVTSDAVTIPKPFSMRIEEKSGCIKNIRTADFISRHVIADTEESIQKYLQSLDRLERVFSEGTAGSYENELKKWYEEQIEPRLVSGSEVRRFISLLDNNGNSIAPRLDDVILISAVCLPRGVSCNEVKCGCIVD